MANFNDALDKTLIFEGFYSNIAKDNGGETYCGVSRRSFPDWVGWNAVDKFKSEFGQPVYNQEITEADKYVEEFYRKTFWFHIKGDEIKNQNLANLIFDVAVNCGTRFSVLIAQEVLRDCFGFLDITLDGKVGHKTLEALNSIQDSKKTVFSTEIPSSYLFLVQMTALRMRRYARLAKDGQQWAIVGWTSRAFSFLGSK